MKTRHLFLAVLSCLIGVTALPAAETTTFRYDALGRLVESRVSGGINDGAIRETGWDQASNRTVYSLSNLPAPASLSVADVVAIEGQSLAFEVTRSGLLQATVSVRYTTSDDTAQAGSDYQTASGEIVFAPNETSKTVVVYGIDDQVVEANKQFRLTLSGTTGRATIARANAIGTVIDNDGTFTVAATTAIEGSSLGFSVSRNGSTGASASVDYAMRGVTAAADIDYTPRTGTLNFQPGEFQKSVLIPTLIDNVIEVDEVVELSLSNAVGGPVLEPTTRFALGTIRDAVTALSIEPATANEGGQLIFRVLRTGNVSGTSTVQYATIDGSAAAGSDFNAINGTITFEPSQLSRDVIVQTLEDTVMEGSENLTVTLSSPTGATIAGFSATGAINNVSPSLLRVADAQAVEGGPLAFVITRSGDTTGTTTVQYATAMGTAIAGWDFTHASGSVSFAPGETTKTVNVATLSDSPDEGSETINLVLSNPVGGVIQRGSAIGTINDPSSFLNVADAQASEGAPLAFVITRSGYTTRTTTVQYATAADTATRGTDFMSSSGIVIFAAGETTKTVNVATLSDSPDEGSETINLVLSDPTGGIIQRGSAIGTINNVGLSFLNVADAQASEGAPLAFVITRSGDITGTITVRYYTLRDAPTRGSATSGIDYTQVDSSVIFGPGEATKTVNVATLSDSVAEGTETLRFGIYYPQGGVMQGNNATGSILGEAALLNWYFGYYARESLGVDQYLPVNRTGDTTIQASVRYTTRDGTALAGSDYTATSGILTFAPGQTEAFMQIPVLNDPNVEPEERFYIDFTEFSGGAGPGDPRPSYVRIRNDDCELSISDATVTEGGNLTFTVTRVGHQGDRIRFSYSTQNETALAGSDYTATPSRLIEFPSGQTSVTFTVPTFNDSLKEQSETMIVTISSSSSNQTIKRAVGKGTINDND